MSIKNTRVSVAVLGSFLLAGAVAPAFAGESTSATKTAAAGNKEVCKRFAKTGTRIKEKICLTQAQWDHIEEESKRAGREILDAGGVDPAQQGG